MLYLKCFGSSLASHTKAVVFLGVFHLGNNCKASRLRTRFLSCIRMCRDTFTSALHLFSPGRRNPSSRVGGKGAPPSLRPAHPGHLGCPPGRLSRAPPPGRPASSVTKPTWPLPARPLGPSLTCPASRGAGAAQAAKQTPGLGRPGSPPPARARPTIRAAHANPGGEVAGQGWEESAPGRSATTPLASTVPRDVQPPRRAEPWAPTPPSAPSRPVQVHPASDPHSARALGPPFRTCFFLDIL